MMTGLFAKRAHLPWLIAGFAAALLIGTGLVLLS